MTRLVITSVESIGNRFIVRFSCTGARKKFLKKTVFFAEYNTSIEGVPEAVLVIPFLGTVCPVAWANQADVYVDTIDETFLHSQKLRGLSNSFIQKLGSAATYMQRTLSNRMLMITQRA